MEAIFKTPQGGFMKQRTKSLLLPIALIATAASASERLRECGHHGSVTEKIEDCRRTNGRNAFRYAGGDNASFWALVEKQSTLECFNENETWIDARTGLSWLPDIGIRVSYEEALSLCGAFDSHTRLPTVEEFETAEAHGLREIFPKTRGKLYWTATPSEPAYPMDAYFYSGGGGYVYDGNRDRAHSIRCVRDIE